MTALPYSVCLQSIASWPNLAQGNTPAAKIHIWRIHESYRRFQEKNVFMMRHRGRFAKELETLK